MTTVISFAEVLQTTINNLEDYKVAQKQQLEDLEKNIKWLQENHAAVTTVEEIHVEELIEHEGKMLKKVERKAETGDYVKFYRLNFAHTSNDKFYKVYSDEKVPFIRNDVGAVENIYGWLNVVVEVYEVFSELPFLPQSKEVAVEPHAILTLTNHAKRIQAIQKAKEYIKYIETSQLYNFKYYINRKKRAVTVLAYDVVSNKLAYKGVAKCHPDDTFNEFIGKAVAIHKSGGFIKVKDEVLNAPNPDGWAVGQVTKGINTCSIYKEEETVSVQGDKAYDRYAKAWEYGAIGRGSCVITDDTNANYEGDK